MSNQRNKHVRHFRRKTWCLAALPGIIMVSLLLAATDTWQRPGFLAHWNDGWFLPLAAIATTFWTWIYTRGLESRRRWFRIGCIVSGFVIVTIGLRLGSDRIAARNLAHQIAASPHANQNKWIVNILVWTAGRLDDIGLPSKWIPEPYYTSERETARYHHLEASRPSLRLQFAREAMKTAKNDPLGRPGRLAVTSWHRLFPAVTGADVTMRQRQRLWNMVRDMHDDDDADMQSRMAAALWMGLITLTDTEFFAKQRPIARDAMLRWHNPPMGGTGDVWMRTLDLLLLPDTPELQKNLTADAVSHATWLRRAIRERVRAVRGHLHLALDELVRRGSDDPGMDGIALWCDMTSYLRDVQVDRNLQLGDNLRAILIEWLHGEWTGKRNSAFLPWESRWWGFLFRQTEGFPFGTMENSREKQRLRERADELLDRLESARTRHFAEQDKAGIAWLDDLDRLLITRHLLEDSDKKRIAIRLGGLLVDLAWVGVESTKNPPQRVWAANEEALHRLAGIWTEIDRADRLRFGQRTSAALVPTEWIHRHRNQYDNLRSVWCAVALDAASEDPQVDSAVRLLFSLHPPDAGPNRHPADRGPSHPLSGPAGYFQFPELSKQEVEAAVPVILGALEGKTFEFGNYRVKKSMVGFRHLMRHSSMTISEMEQLLRALLAAKGMTRNESDMTILFGILTGSQPALLEPLLHFRHLWVPWHVDSHFIDWVIASPERLGKLLAAEPNQIITEALLERLEQDNNDPETIEIARAHFEQASRSNDPTAAFEALACLLRIAPQLDPEAVQSVRGRLLDAIDQCKPSFETWPTTYSFASGPARRFRWGLFTPRSLLSDGVPWSDDELAACYAWSSDIKAQTIFPEGWGFMITNEMTHVFAALAGALKIDVDFWDDSIYFQDVNEPLDLMAWRIPPPELPFEPTPWQRARELHQRRPDLRFRDRAMLRPVRGKRP